MFKEAFNCHRQ